MVGRGREGELEISGEGMKEGGIRGEIIKNYCQLNFFQGVDFWRHPWKVETPVDLHVTLAQLPTVKAMFEKYGIQYRVKVANLQK